MPTPFTNIDRESASNIIIEEDEDNNLEFNKSKLKILLFHLNTSSKFPYYLNYLIYHHFCVMSPNVSPIQEDLSVLIKDEISPEIKSYNIANISMAKVELLDVIKREMNYNKCKTNRIIP